MARQYVEARFRKGPGSYTYHNDGEPVAPGDEVFVVGQHSEQRVTVVALLDEPPPFQTKPIIRKAANPGEPEQKENSDVE